MNPVKSSHARGRTIGSLGLAVLLLSGRSWGEGEDSFNEGDLKIPLWNYSAELRGELGYKDNVLLSHAHAQGSAFWMSRAEILAFRLPTRGWQFSFFADASDARYFDAPGVEGEQTALAAAQLSKDFGSGWKSTVGLNYLFQNQVFDFSETYASQTSIGQILGHTIAPRWGIRRTISRFWVEGEWSGARQWLAEPLDDYWQFGPRAAVGWDWAKGSGVALSYRYSRIDYDTRSQASSLGETLPNTSLALNSHSAEFSFTQVWDKKGRWQTITSVGYEANLDNGSGFYDYNNYRLSQQFRYRDERWEILAKSRLGYFDYPSQPLSVTETTHRRKTMLNVTLRIERKLTKHLKVHASYYWDRSLSNLDFDDYAASTLMGGLAFTF